MVVDAVADDLGVVRKAEVRLAQAHELARWDELVAANPDGGSVWRGREYSEHERVLGFTPVYLMVDDIACTVLERRIPLLGRLWHLPAGPGVLDVTTLMRVSDALAEFAAEQGVFTVRIEPLIRDDAAERERLLAAGYRRVPGWAPSHTIVVDITGSEDDVLARFGQRARRWIRKAARVGVVVERVEATDENCRILYDLLTATADGRFPIRTFEHVRSLYQRLQASGNGQLFLARLDGKVVAGAYAMLVGDNALYLTGASVRKEPGRSEENGLGAHGVGHAVQWELMRWAREHGAVRYDMCGTPPSWEADDPAHPLHGVGQFKLSFDKTIVDYIGAYDVPARRIRANLLYGYERMLIAAAERPLFRRFLT
ncbi:peptidoglycan bridge formation glycyltransferase FemA/FemB family protein [Rhodococcus sp. HM1]|uniref:lipid II:glycine glycyltransferase FemX n=1 Tax=Rhodococcus sp. HM1 TaxID=2937759 RepID=UPI00200AEB84|nr:peptidoglycan bridge formation glycyltransferase FemA/FemB family protein [Rhodococcus sp. HM1]MCK8675417.1 peptidoglycan bridge formation glycyltransferase FemA/FemB family protein [Rhodococcus sp. HM1]